MKKLLNLSMLILAVTIFTNANGQDSKKMAMNTVKSIEKNETKTERKEIRKEERNLVSNLSEENLLADFKGISNISWTRENSADVASFMKDGMQYKAFYDENSKLLGTTTSKTLADLPKNGQKELQKRYKDYKIDKVVFFENNDTNDNDMVLYGTQFESMDNYFAELVKGDKKIVVQINPKGEVFFFKALN